MHPTAEPDFETDLFRPVDPPAGPVVERYSGVAWPGGRFES